MNFVKKWTLNTYKKKNRVDGSLIFCNHYYNNLWGTYCITFPSISIKRKKNVIDINKKTLKMYITIAQNKSKYFENFENCIK